MPLKSNSNVREDAPVKYVTIDQAARELQVDPSTIRRHIASGDLEAVKIGKRKRGTVRDTRPIRIPVSAIEAILEPIVRVRDAL